MSTREVTFPTGRKLRVLEHRAAAHDFAHWEQEFLTALLALLKPGMVVYDVGAEEGEFSALVASVVGGEHVHLFEPSPGVWPNIRAVWDANQLAGPGGAWHGFAGSEGRRGGSICSGGVWPAAASGPIQTESAFAALHERPDLPAISLDEYARETGTAPDVVMMDVEGAEVLVLQGMQRLLSEARPLVFVSVHPPSFIQRFGDMRDEEHHRLSQEHVFRCVLGHGYTGRFLGHDHESHWLLVPIGKHTAIKKRLG